MPRTVVGEANESHGSYYPRYLLFTPDGTRILHGSVSAVIRVLDLSLRVLIEIPTVDCGDWARLLDGRIIVSGSQWQGSYSFWDATSGTPIRFCTASRGSEGLDLTRLASAPDDLTAQRWERVIGDADRWQEEPRVRNDMHNRVAYLSEGAILVDEESSNNRIANLNVGRTLPYNLRLSPSGTSMSFRVHGSDDRYLWNIETQTVYRLDNPFGHDVHDSPDGHYVGIPRFSDIVIWDTCTGALVSILNFGYTFRGWWTFSPDGQYIIAADHQGRVKLWDINVALLRGPYISNPPLTAHNGIVDFSR